MPDYSREELNCRLVVGMEVHVELATRTKMWTSAPNVAHRENFEAEPNTLLDPVVIGMPGTLPVMNKAAVEMSMLVGLALNCAIAEYTKWDRKSYYYPDLPKNYQISQYDLPLCFDGAIDIPVNDESGNMPDPGTKRIGIIRAHLEEDAGKLLHEAPGGVAISGSIVDLNRAGTPLLEIVTEPDFGSADEVVTFCNVLRDICRHLGVTEGIMQKGHMRFEPNINVVIETPDGKTHKTPVVEIKNLNSFRAVHGAIVHESERQVEEWLETGKEMGAGAKSTRGWDDVKGVTTLQREKEDAHDYRYFPDPDLVSVTVDAEWLEAVKSRLVELPLVKKSRYVEELGLKEEDATALVDEPAASRFFEAVLDAGGDARKSAAMLLNSGVKRCNEQACTLEELGITPVQVVEIQRLIADDKVSSGAADKLFGLCCEADESAEALAEANGLMQVSDDSALEGWVDEVLANPGMAKAIEDIKAGKGKAIGALMGQVMKLSKGSANPKRVTEMIRSKLGG
ncbi:MAG: Asp-tRNA(Asn)/Glu-tRNA(Gln) amidotransferase subunit GatB [Planctomycetota bacterium]